MTPLVPAKTSGEQISEYAQLAEHIASSLTRKDFNPQLWEIHRRRTFGAIVSFYGGTR